MPALKDLTGQTFGKLQVKGRGPNLRKKTRWVCQCECGKEVLIAAHNLLVANTRSCGCLVKRTGNANPTWLGHGEIPKQHWTHIQFQAISRGMEFKLSIEEGWQLYLDQNRACALTGLPISFGSRKAGQVVTASLDRIDNSRGYTVENVQWVHKHVNIMKRDHSESYFIELCSRVAAWGKQ